MNLDLQKVLPAEAFETEQNEGDYIGKDGLLYCGVCRTKKQTRLPASDFTADTGGDGCECQQIHTVCCR